MIFLGLEASAMRVGCRGQVRLAPEGERQAERHGKQRRGDRRRRGGGPARARAESPPLPGGPGREGAPGEKGVFFNGAPYDALFHIAHH